MSELPPPLPSTPQPLPGDPGINYQSTLLVDRDSEHLKILAICWYVIAGLSALGGCLPLFYVGMGAIFLVTPPPAGGGPPPAAIGAIIAAFGAFFAILIWLGAVLAFLTGRALTNRNRITLVYVTAALACLSIPIGTVLGIFTFVILSRPTVRNTFT